MSNIVWVVVTILIFVSGIYYTFKLRFVQFDIKNMVKSLFNRESNDKGISPIASLLMTLGARIGVGSIAGVAFAIYYGGVGSIFWLWVVGLVAMPNCFAETVLGMIYQEKDGDMYKGGPSYYISKGMGNKWLGGVYAVLIILSYVFGSVSIQANTITKSLLEVVNVSKVIIGICVSITVIMVISGGLKKIVVVINKLVPFMTILYLGCALLVFINNMELIPEILGNIWSNAFKIRPLGGGLIGGFMIGIQRGIFSNEAGLGTCSISSSSSNNSSCVSQGYLQMIGIYITTFLICSATAIIILSSNYEVVNISDVNGIEITQYAFNYHFSSLGTYILLISILLFSFSSILTGYYDGESSLKFFSTKISLKWIWLLRIGSVLVVYLGCVLESSTVWKMVDVMTAWLGLINIYALIKMRHDVYYEYLEYSKK